MDWTIHNIGQKGKGQKAVDTTGKLDTVLCQHHEIVERNSVTTIAIRAKG